jgi:hypothetical protein
LVTAPRAGRGGGPADLRDNAGELTRLHSVLHALRGNAPRVRVGLLHTRWARRHNAHDEDVPCWSSLL